MKILILILASVAAFGQATTPLKVSQSSGSLTGNVWLQERRTNGTNWLKIEAPQAIAADFSLILPGDDGEPLECMKTDGAGVLSWGSCSTNPVASNYDWSYTNGTEFSGSVSIGANTITVTPCPDGIASSYGTVQFYLTGGTGAAETVAMTGGILGGTCTSGAASGTITFTAANAHSGAYTIGSATDGAQEAWNVASATSCPTLNLGDATYEFRGSLNIPKCSAVITTGGGATINAYDADSPAINATYSGVGARRFRVTGPLQITSSGTHTAGSASILAEGWTDGGVQKVICTLPYRCVDWYANGTGGGNPITIRDIQGDGAINRVVSVRSALGGQTAGFMSHIYGSGATASGIYIAGVSAGWTINHLWFQGINIGIEIQETAGLQINEVVIAGPCIIDGPKAAGISAVSTAAPGTNAMSIRGCLIQIDAGGIGIVTSGMSRLVVEGNTINQIGANYAIAISDADNSSISGNTIQLSNALGTAYGIGLVTTASADIQISRNTIRRVGGAATQIGLQFQALTHSSVNYCGNEFYQMTTDVSDSSTGGVSRCSPIVGGLDIGVPAGNVNVEANITSGAQRLRLGYLSTTSVPVSNITPAQILADSNGNLLISSRTDNASGLKFFTNQGVLAVERFAIGSTGIGTFGYGLDITGGVTVTLNGSPYSNPITVRNTAIGVLGSCIVVAATDSATATVHGAGRLCGRYDTASFADELVTIQTATGSGTYTDAIQIKNTNVTVIGTFVAQATSLASLTMAGNQTPGIDGLGSVGITGTRYGGMATYALNAGGGSGAITFLPGAAPTVGDVWTASSTAGVGGWSAIPTCVNCIVNGGNSLASTLVIGTNDNQALNFETNGTQRWGFSAAGNLLPFASSTYSIGSSGARVLDVHTNYVDVYTDLTINAGATVTAPNGFGGATTTLSCVALQAIKTITVSAGIVTAVTCGVP